MARKKRSYTKKTSAATTASQTNAPIKPTVSKTAEGRTVTKDKELIRIKELVEVLVEKQPSLSGLKEKELIEFLKNTFDILNEKFDTTDNKVVVLGSIGRFRVNNFEREVDGEVKAGRRIVFTPAQPQSA